MEVLKQSGKGWVIFSMCLMGGVCSHYLGTDQGRLEKGINKVWMQTMEPEAHSKKSPFEGPNQKNNVPHLDRSNIGLLAMEKLGNHSYPDEYRGAKRGSV